MVQDAGAVADGVIELCSLFSAPKRPPRYVVERMPRQGIVKRVKPVVGKGAAAIPEDGHVVKDVTKPSHSEQRA